ncbi:OmpP1/FadL family transporter [Yoonia maritima]|uniref:OmpP1/FadL family transporter n=1 Tax=Yoonia maritima TaxID=1435347 RepID=UPI003736D7C5
MTIKSQTTLFGLTVAAGTLCATAVAAGTPERSGQSITPIFERGTYGELSFSAVSPDLTGETVGGDSISDLGDTYFAFAGAFKKDINDSLSFGVVFDQPWGANITYNDDATNGVFTDANTEWNSAAITALGRYKLGNGFSIHGGIRAETLEIDVNLPAAGAENTIKESTGFGYTIGAAYEIPAKAARISLTYHSAVEHKADVSFNDADDGETTFDMPESLNLEFRHAVSPTTVIFGSARYIDWTSLDINTNSFGDLVGYADDTLQTSFGVGRGFSKEWAGAITVDYEPPTDSPVSDLSPTDGKFGLGIGGTYTRDQTKISGLVKVLSNGDAVSNAGSAFNDNTTLAVGFKIARTF